MTLSRLAKMIRDAGPCTVTFWYIHIPPDITPPITGTVQTFDKLLHFDNETQLHSILQKMRTNKHA